VRRVKRTERRSVPPVRRGLFRWTALLQCNDKGDSTVGIITATNQAGRVCYYWDWFPDYLSIILLLRIVLSYFTERGYHTGISMTTRHRNAAATPQQIPLQTQTQQRAQQQHIVINHRNKGGIQSKWNGIIIRTSETTTTNVGNQSRRGGYPPEHATGAADVGNFYFIWDYTGKRLNQSITAIHRTSKGGDPEVRCGDLS